MRAGMAIGRPELPDEPVWGAAGGADPAAVDAVEGDGGDVQGLVGPTARREPPLRGMGCD
jgi:hypothetical protein